MVLLRLTGHGTFRLWGFVLNQSEQIEADHVGQSPKGKAPRQLARPDGAAAEQMQKLRGVAADVDAGLENWFSTEQPLPDATWKQLLADQVLVGQYSYSHSAAWQLHVSLPANANASQIQLLPHYCSKQRPI